MKITLNKKEANAIYSALHFYVFETTHDSDGEAIVGLPEGEEKKLLTSTMDKLLKSTRDIFVKRGK